MIDQPHEEKPALTIVIQSWWTPAAAVIMLVIGMVVGYVGRPLLNNGSSSTGNVVGVTTPAVTQPVNQTAVATSSIDPTLAAIDSQQKLMDYLVSQTTHFQGDPNATVTMIEFSDYQ